jgi:predicted ATPase with chaperone activity
MSVSEMVADVRVPFAPLSLQESGLNFDLLLQLTLKTLHLTGEQTGYDLASRIGVAFSVVAPVLEFLKTQRHCEISGGAMVGGPSYKFRITDAGRERAALFLEHNHYIGRAPVPLSQYRRYMDEFRAPGSGRATRENVRRAFSHLVVSDRVLDQLGPAINAGHSMFIYGPPGNGKTVISQAIRNLLEGDIAIPYAVEVEGSIIQFFDPVNHEERSVPTSAAGLDGGVRHDGRWTLCRRPMVMVGGELTLAQLDLRYNAGLGYYRAPIQAAANGGVLVIDDFGRQACAPRDLLNRWIVPLESRVDFLTLQTGQKVDFPFMAMIVFATNMNPSELVDEAFLRRIHYKIYAESPTVPEFMEIFERCCRDRGVAFRREIVDELLKTYYEPRGIQLRGCHPRDLIAQATSLAEYLGQSVELTPELMASACSSYFVDNRGALPS